MIYDMLYDFILKEWLKCNDFCILYVLDEVYMYRGMCILYVVWKEYKLYIISLIYLIVVIKFLGRKFLMFG